MITKTSIARLHFPFKGMCTQQAFCTQKMPNCIAVVFCAQKNKFFDA